MLVTRSFCVIPHTVLIFGAQLGRAGQSWSSQPDRRKKSKLHAFVQICDNADDRTICDKQVVLILLEC